MFKCFTGINIYGKIFYCKYKPKTKIKSQKTSESQKIKEMWLEKNKSLWQQMAFKTILKT